MKLDLSEIFYSTRELTLEEAKQIREMKRGCTYRKLAELCLNHSHIGYGNQGVGEVFCRLALKILYPNDDIWMMYKPEEKFGKTFVDENKSYCGNFYWWE